MRAHIASAQSRIVVAVVAWCALGCAWTAPTTATPQDRSPARELYRYHVVSLNLAVPGFDFLETAVKVTNDRRIYGQSIDVAPLVACPRSTNIGMAR